MVRYVFFCFHDDAVIILSRMSKLKDFTDGALNSMGLHILTLTEKIHGLERVNGSLSPTIY